MARLSVPKKDIVLINKGVEVRLSRDYSQLEAESMARLREILKPYPRAARMLDLVIDDVEMRANWDMSDYLAVTKLGFNDHGEVHHKVVATGAASLLQLLVEGGVQPDVVASGGGELDDAFLVVIVGSLLHDIGNQVHREGHPAMGVVLSLDVLKRLLAEIYEEPEQRYEIRGFILHAIRAHDVDVPPLTMEAGIIAVADACDMTKGRARFAFDLGSVTIHQVGALAIERVVIERGKTKPIRITVELNNSAGIFPVEEFLMPKVTGSALAPYAEVTVTTEPEESDTDRRILYSVEMQGKRFVATDGGHAAAKKVEVTTAPSTKTESQAP